MEKTPHIQLVGDGAQVVRPAERLPARNAAHGRSDQGVVERHPDKKKWQDKPPVKGVPNSADITMPVSEHNHDTVTVLARADGRLGGVCTTSGLAYKPPGRVGDSPIIGAGLYVDDQAGAAGATGGRGDHPHRRTSFVVEQMRAGKTPQEACEIACQRVNATAARRGVHPVNVAFLALDPEGQHRRSLHGRHELPVRGRPRR